jgi:Rod binding domain-containing protein
MNIGAISSNPSAADVAPESLVGNQSLNQHQKIAEASRQFESILLRQIIGEAEKPMIKSEFTDNSTAAGIYQDFITNQLSDSLSKSGAIGFAKVFERQLDKPEKSTAPGTNVNAGANAGQTDKLSTLTHE